MKKTKCVVFATLLAALAIPSTALGNTVYRYSGHDCRARDAADTGWWYDSEGIRNNHVLADSERHTWCPVTAWQNSTVNLDAAKVFYHDGTVHRSIGCQLFVTNNTGGLATSQTRYSCGADTTNGCTSGAFGSTEAGHASYGSIAWATTNLPSMGGDTNNAGAYGYFCSVPSRSNTPPLEGSPVTEQYSRIISYLVDQINP
jgi:hypothetical protein